MRLLDRTTGLTASPIAEAKAWLSERSSTRFLLDLSQAAPSYPTATQIAERVAEVARSHDGGAYAPPPGLPGLNEAFAAELGVAAENVLPTAGCNQAFCIVASTLAEPGDEMIVPLPYYFNHAMWLELDGVKPVFLRCGTDLVPDPDVAAGLINDKTRAILLVTPGNPTGVTIPPDVIHQFARLARDHDIALVIDETYRNFRETVEPAHDLYADPDWAETIITLHSFSKDLAIPGYRVGAVVGSPSLLYEAAKLLDCVAICAPRIGQEAVITGLTEAAAWRREQSERILRSLHAFRTTMATEPGGFELVSSGAFFGWVRHPFPDLSTSEVVRRLVLEHDVLVIPGTAFLPDDEGMLRFSFANLESHEFSELGNRLVEAGTDSSRRSQRAGSG